MDELLSLWLPIVISAVVVFIVSAVFWMAPLHHKNDWVKPSNEDSVLGALRSLKPGQYMIPWCQGADMKTEEGKRRFQEGPHASIILRSGPPNMGKNMVFTFLFYLVVGVFVAYIASLTRDPGASFAEVFQVAGTAGVMAYALGWVPGAIWYGRSARSLINDLLDGVIYGLLTGAIFAWMWPSVESAVNGALPAG